MNSFAKKRIVGEKKKKVKGEKGFRFGNGGRRVVIKERVIDW